MQAVIQHQLRLVVDTFENERQKMQRVTFGQFRVNITELTGVVRTIVGRKQDTHQDYVATFSQGMADDVI